MSPQARLTIFAALALVSAQAPLFGITSTYTVTGTWQAPAGVTSVVVEAWGGGGGGGGQGVARDGAGGGGGGAYSKKSGIAVVPGNTYTVNVGTPGTGGYSWTAGKDPGGPGGDSWFISISTVFAQGGKGGYADNLNTGGGVGGLAGQSSAGVGDVKYGGGNGGKGRSHNTGIGAPGGSSAGISANGTHALQTWATEIAAAPPDGGGIGGDGGNCTTNCNGLTPASGYGGGGGGSAETTGGYYGGAGASGRVLITYSAYLASVTFNNDFPSASSGTILVNYKLLDDDYDPCNFTGTGAGVQWSRDGSSWSNATMGAGGDGNTGLASSPSPGTSHKYAWNLGADLAGVEDETVYLRIAAHDGNTAGPWQTSNSFKVDTRAPQVVSSAYFAKAPLSGDTAFSIGAAFSDMFPAVNWFAYRLNGAAYTGAAGDAGTDVPQPKSFSVTLNGDDVFTAIASTHTDQAGNKTTTETSTLYVRPMDPYPAIVNSPVAAGFTVRVQPNPRETGVNMVYAIRVTGPSMDMYVQADGTLSASDVWQTAAAWGARTVTGLASGTRYNVLTRAGNPGDGSPTFAENSASEIGSLAAVETAGAAPPVSGSGMSLQGNTMTLEQAVLGQ